MSEIFTFNFDNVDLRAIEMDDQIWTVGTDVCKALGYRDAENGLRNLDKDEKGTHIMSTAGGDQNFLTINESGLYSLIFRSRKPEAKRFKKTDFNDETLAELLATGIGTYMPERVSWQRPLH
ncbi:BRO-N domain-containing protein [Thalassospira sp. UBA1131]|uniref:BRO-N domain-containing protein n=1 Tax=Thalassospira sp. UBA1131 TaxID=1947672 RepID=UPI0025D94EAF|nr:BRO family protein [Thalassospira sp. UBA1131]